MFNASRHPADDPSKVFQPAILNQKPNIYAEFWAQRALLASLVNRRFRVAINIRDTTYFPNQQNVCDALQITGPDRCDFPEQLE
jgi:hypothetical protein